MWCFRVVPCPILFLWMAKESNLIKRQSWRETVQLELPDISSAQLDEWFAEPQNISTEPASALIHSWWPDVIIQLSSWKLKNHAAVVIHRVFFPWCFEGPLFAFQTASVFRPLLAFSNRVSDTELSSQTSVAFQTSRQISNTLCLRAFSDKNIYLALCKSRTKFFTWLEHLFICLLFMLFYYLII